MREFLPVQGCDLAERCFDSSGNIFGTTSAGGDTNGRIVFEITP
jgi:hypothetical protein